MVLLAGLGWLVGLIAAVAWWRLWRRTDAAQPPVQAPAPIVVESGHDPPPVAIVDPQTRSWPAILLYEADGRLVSIRRLHGAPTPTMTRRHGRDRETRYRLTHYDTMTARYDADA